MVSIDFISSLIRFKKILKSALHLEIFWKYFGNLVNIPHFLHLHFINSVPPETEQRFKAKGSHFPPFLISLEQNLVNIPFLPLLNSGKCGHIRQCVLLYSSPNIPITTTITNNSLQHQAA